MMWITRWILAGGSVCGCAWACVRMGARIRANAYVDKRARGVQISMGEVGGVDRWSGMRMDGGAAAIRRVPAAPDNQAL